MGARSAGVAGATPVAQTEEGTMIPETPVGGGSDGDHDDGERGYSDSSDNDDDETSTGDDDQSEGESDDEVARAAAKPPRGS